MASENGKFKVGDRVRRIGRSPWPEQYGVEGQEYTVLSVTGGGAIVVIDGQSGAFADSFELVPAWQPKVGDRVRFTDECNTFWLFGPHTEDKKFGVITNANGNEFWVSVGAAAGIVELKHIEPANNNVATPAVLTIEAGKFYKTRDGRKVGPVYSENGYYVADAWHYNKNGECGLFGTHNPDEDYRDDKDLVALWEEPASNDNAAGAKPKFKVGDIVKRSNGYSPGRTLRITEVISQSNITAEWLDGGSGSTHRWQDYEFELIIPPTTPAIVALIENGTPRPSTAPKVHTSQEAAATEAERLALEYPGQQFGVFVLADSKIADLVTTQTAVLRAA